MCGRKYDSEVAERERELSRFNIYGPGRKRGRRSSTHQVLELPPPNFDIRPTNQHVVIIAQAGDIAPAVMRWGFKPDWAKAILFNSRADKLSGRTWSKPFREQRCVIPVGGFYEWSGPKNARQPHAIQYADKRMLYLAGLWVEHEGERCYSVITTEASSFMAKLHDREPVAIHEDSVEAYLTADKPPMEMMHAAEAGELSEFACASLKKDAPPVPL